MKKLILVTGGAGFIGSALIRKILNTTDWNVVNVDKLTYAGHRETVADVESSSRYAFEHADICDMAKMKRIFEQYAPQGVIHLAAESHVDRSIDGPAEFINTNIIGTYTLLEAARKYWVHLATSQREAFRFHHVSTDEVYGSLGAKGHFTESTPYRPSSPYSSSKAAADHLVRAWQKTYDLPTVVSNCSNNYGPYQYPEKLIPVIITKALHEEAIPIYGAGQNVRDWLYVDDHAEALVIIFNQGVIGETYNVGGKCELSNLTLARLVCESLAQMTGCSGKRHYESLIEFVTDRPGHDLRYAMDVSKIEAELGWQPNETIESGLRKTVRWYVDNQQWCRKVSNGRYGGERLGMGSQP